SGIDAVIASRLMHNRRPCRLRPTPKSPIIEIMTRYQLSSWVVPIVSSSLLHAGLLWLAFTISLTWSARSLAVLPIVLVAAEPQPVKPDPTPPPKITPPPAPKRVIIPRPTPVVEPPRPVESTLNPKPAVSTLDEPPPPAPPTVAERPQPPAPTP